MLCTIDEFTARTQLVSLDLVMLEQFGHLGHITTPHFIERNALKLYGVRLNRLDVHHGFLAFAKMIDVLRMVRASGKIPNAVFFAREKYVNVILSGALCRLDKELR